MIFLKRINDLRSSLTFVRRDRKRGEGLVFTGDHFYRPYGPRRFWPASDKYLWPPPYIYTVYIYTRSGVDTLVTQPWYSRFLFIATARRRVTATVEFTGEEGPRPALIHPCNCPRPRNATKLGSGRGGRGGEGGTRKRRRRTRRGESFEVDDIHRRRRFSRRRKQCGKVAFHQGWDGVWEEGGGGLENSHASATSWSRQETFLDRGCPTFDQMSARAVFFPSSPGGTIGYVFPCAHRYVPIGFEGWIMRAKQATRGLERYWKVRTRLPPLDCTSEGQEFLRGEKGEGGRWISILRNRSNDRRRMKFTRRR